MKILGSGIVLATLSLFTICSDIATADSEGPGELRQFVGQQVGGIDRLKVPATNAGLPVPRQADGTVPYRYELTEAKRFLGKLLFHDPIRTARIDKNVMQPKNLPDGTDFGGTFGATDPLIQRILPGTTATTGSEVSGVLAATLQTGSCAGCHIGEAAGKAGQQLNFNVGSEGRGYTDAKGNFFPRRRPQSVLVKLRTTPIFPGDALVDAFPTLTDIWSDHGTEVITTPAYFYHYPNPPGTLNPPEAIADPNLQLIATGRLDQLDSVARMSPSMVGFAFNNRLLLGGFAGEPQTTPGSLNPFTDPAQENLTLLLLDAHRMIGFQSDALQNFPAFVKLFTDAFPQEAAAAAQKGNPKGVITDDTEFRAQAAFLRTVVTRNTPFDRFLAGDDKSLTRSQQRGARLFFTSAAAGGAGCFTCHSGPMLNKQPSDKDVTGVGALVEDNFINVGIGDHPIQALNALAKGHLASGMLGTDGYPYHAEDTGRQEILHDASGAFRFRALTLRQLKDGRNFMHSGSFTKVRDVVEYFNAGVPQDPTAAAAPTLSARFTNPRGAGYPRGLGLSERQVDDLTDFLENGLYDPGLVNYDPNSPTDTFQPNQRDLAYSKYHPELVAADPLHVKDGVMLSGLAIDSNDPLTRRDEGLEFLDVTSQATITLANRDTDGAVQEDVYRITNNSSSIIDTHLLVIAQGLPSSAQLQNGSGTTSGGVPLQNGGGNTIAGKPYLRVFLPNGVLLPGQTTVQTLRLKRPQGSGLIRYAVQLLSGQGIP